MADASRPGAGVLGFAVVALLIFLGLALFSTNPPTEVGDKDVGYISGKEVNIRKCPSLKCESTATYYQQQQVVIIDDDVRGDESHGSRQWIKIQYGDEVRYVHAYFISLNPGSLAENLGRFTLVAELLVVIGIMVAIGWERAHNWATKKERAANYTLATGTLAFGLAAGIVAFLIARSDGQSNGSFLSSALANVGAGLVGAAVTFVLFQVVLNRRNPTREQVAELQIQLATLTQAVQNSDPRTGLQAEEVLHTQSNRVARAWILAAALMTTAIGWIFRRQNSHD